MPLSQIVDLEQADSCEGTLSVEARYESKCPEGMGKKSIVNLYIMHSQSKIAVPRYNIRVICKCSLQRYNQIFLITYIHQVRLYQRQLCPCKLQYSRKSSKAPGGQGKIFYAWENVWLPFLPIPGSWSHNRSSSERIVQCLKFQHLHSGL